MTDEQILQFIEEKGLDSKIVSNMVTAAIDRRVEELVSAKSSHILETLTHRMLESPVTIDGKKYESFGVFIESRYKNAVQELNLSEIIKEKIGDAVYDIVVGWD